MRHNHKITSTQQRKHNRGRKASLDHSPAGYAGGKLSSAVEKIKRGNMEGGGNFVR